ncbi:glycosyltransferase [Amycolatopsis taiwanensis]|uniref:glycosyltransferase n=1 Tax=Amycolatopsis taiwanensis TaxID=342230 RepID=UPI000482AADD|nr:glycosyltransferase [Amycolatopsis taiwanensis]
MLVQRTLFAPPNDLEPAELYATTERGVAVAERGRVTVAPHALVSTNTYFGRFPASYWQRWTPVGRVRVEARAHGTGRVRLMASDTAGDARPVDGVRVSGAVAEPIGLHATLNRFTDGGALWLEADTEAAELTVGDVRWEVNDRARERPAAVVICTYNRADDCVATLTTLAADVECMAGLDTVYVVDQGSDPVSSRTGFDAVKQALGGKLRYLRQPNLGGAGGFTRGLYEATSGAAENWPYLVLMDDDIALEPDTVPRMIAFAARTEHPAIVGGQMLQQLHPHRLHVSAERADLPHLRAGRPVPGAVHDADLTSTSLDTRVNAEYNAWWSCLIPPDIVREIGYPLPLFFQWDDIEYGLRARAAGYPTVTLPGAGVWHADFAWKDWDDWPRYFSLRNALIVSAVHSDFNVRQATKFLLAEFGRYLVSMRYGLARTLLMAVEDFLRGPQILADGGAQAAAAVRKARAHHPETVVHPAHGAPDLPVSYPAPTPSMPRLVLLKRAAWQMLGVARGQATIAAKHNHWWHVSLFDTAVVTDPSQEGVRFRHRNPALLRDLAWRGVRVLSEFSRRAPRVGRLYRAAMPELTSRRNWARLFGADSRAHL